MFQAKIDGTVDLLKKSPSGENVALLGISRVAAQVYANLSQITDPGENVIGYINVDPVDKSSNGFSLPRQLGGLDNFQEIIKTYGIKRVVLTVDPSDIERLQNLIQRCEAEKVQYSLLPKTYIVGNGKRQESQEEPERPELNVPPEIWIQRPLDLLISLMLFLLFLPSWVFIAIAIKLESKGGILYSQERVGLNEHTFRIYKFRSMYTDAEKRGVPQLATQNDPRITKVGLILRKTRLDELPQLVNIIRGDMSLIGPRPERPFFVEKYNEDMPNYKDRLKVKPGLTGHAQVETGYDESIEDVRIKLQHDLYYIENRHSYKLYWKIWLKTVWVVLTAKGQ